MLKKLSQFYFMTSLLVLSSLFLFSGCDKNDENNQVVHQKPSSGRDHQEENSEDLSSGRGLKKEEIAQLEIKTLNLINLYRQSRGLKSLLYNNLLHQMAAGHSKNMAFVYFETNHRDFESRSGRIFSEMKCHSVAENVAMNYKFSDPAKMAVEMWKDSPGHHQNIIKDWWKGGHGHTALGIRQAQDGAFYFTQIFATCQ